MLARRRNRGNHGIVDVFDSLFQNPWWGESFNMSSPAELAENQDNYVLSLEAPALDDIKVTFDNDVLFISAEKSSVSENPQWSNRTYGKFERSYQFTNIDPDKVEATYSKGVLTITLGKLEKCCQTKKEIEVKCCD